MAHLEPILQEDKLVDDALTALKGRTRIVGSRLRRPQEDSQSNDWADECLTLDCNSAAMSFEFVYECKSQIDRTAQIAKICRRFEEHGERGLLVTSYISRELAEYCIQIQQEFIDTHGNAYLDRQGLFVLVTGERKDTGYTHTRSVKGLSNPGALRVAFALLSRRETISWKFKDIANAAGVALGTVNNALDDLERRGYLINKGNSANRKLLAPERLLEEWVINYPTSLRDRQLRHRFRIPENVRWQDIAERTKDASWSGEVGAWMLDRHLKPATQTLYVSPHRMSELVSELVKTFRLRPDTDGTFEVLERFWDPALELEEGVAPPVLVYAELHSMFDARVSNEAARIRSNWLEPSYN
jgi:hypothetical protein